MFRLSRPSSGPLIAPGRAHQRRPTMPQRAFLGLSTGRWLCFRRSSTVGNRSPPPATRGPRAPPWSAKSAGGPPSQRVAVDFAGTTGPG